MYFQTLLGRRDPSASKIRYLIHLEDCRRISLEGMTEAKENANDIRTKLLSHGVFDMYPPCKQDLEVALRVIETDLTHLESKLKEAENHITNQQLKVEARYHTQRVG